MISLMKILLRHSQKVYRDTLTDADVGRLLTLLIAGYRLLSVGIQLVIKSPNPNLSCVSSFYLHVTVLPLTLA